MSNNTISPDYLHVQTNKDIAKLILNEVVFFSDKINQISSYNMATKRIIIVTSNTIYLFKQSGPKKRILKKQIDLKDIATLTKSLKSTQFIVHTLSDYFRFKSSKTTECIELIKIAYVSLVHKNLPIYGADMKDLKGVKKISKEFKLLCDENLMKEEEKIDLKEEDYGEAESNSWDTASDDYADEPNVVEEGSFDYDERDHKWVRSSTLYSKESVDEAVFEDFLIKQVLGVGSFGKVYLVENKNTGKIHAMKSIKKDKIQDYDKMESTKLEEHILHNSEHPNIVSLDYVFKSEKRIYFIMQFVRGGELFKQIIDWRRFEEQRAKFYAAQITLALGHLHSQNVLYRDLKPENVLLGDDGYVYLTDFGLSRILSKDEIAKSFWGTAEYLAPEMVTSSGHNYGIDWWALGILIYEMIVGIPPFYHKNRDHMFFLIKEAEIKYPDPKKHGITVSEDAKDLINKLLVKDMDNRLGNLSDGKEILAHPWFADLKIKDVVNKTMVPPFKPEISDKYDTSYFDPTVTEMDPEESD
jgi:serum/glucocorticoid-regulated kinase 2